MDKYLQKVTKSLKCAKDEKERIISDLKSGILIALENGESWDEIKKRLGDPKEFACEFNDNLGTVTKSYKKLIIGIVCGIIVGIVCIVGYQYLSSPQTRPIEESKIFDNNHLIEASQKVVEYFNHEDYDGIATMYSDILKEQSSLQQIADAVKKLGDKGAFSKVSEYQFIEYRNKGETIAVGDIVVEYTKRTVIYRLSFDENMKLVGIYMR